MKTYDTLPENLPRPVDDGACDHLIGTKLPDIDLGATDGSFVNLSKQPRKTVIYCYPMTGKPGCPCQMVGMKFRGRGDARPKVVHSEITIRNCLLWGQMFLA